jgi:hypothetical protein
MYGLFAVDYSTSTINDLTMYFYDYIILSRLFQHVTLSTPPINT